MSSRRYTVVILCAALSICLLFMLVPSRSSPGMDGYNSWADINNDGTVDIYDAILLANAFNKNGQNLTKASVSYDSGWVNIKDKQGQDILITHDLNISDWNDEKVMVDITGKTILDGELHRSLGLYNLEGWNKTYGGTGSEGFSALVQTVDGGYALTGETSSYGAGSVDSWLVKTDASGNMQWNKTYGGTSTDIARALAQTSDGGYALAGVTYSFGAGDYDFWLVKTDASGTMQWNKTYGGTGHDQAYALVQTADGGYALTGITKSYGAGSFDFWLVKTDANGNMQWNKTYGGTGDDRESAFVQTSDGGYALTGETSSYGAGSVDSWLVKTDASGNHLWNVTYGGTNNDYGDDLVQTADGGYALTGITNSFGAGGWDAWLVKTDSAGNALWNMTYGGTGIDGAYDLVKTADGGYALTGSTNSFGAGSDDFWLVKTDSAGNALWNKTYGGTSTDNAWDLVQTVDGGYALAGSTNSFGAGSQDFWLVRTDALGTDVGGEYGLVWANSTTNTITLHRGALDPNWNYVRIRILKVR